MQDKDFSEDSSRRMQIFALECCLGALKGLRSSSCSVKASLINIHMKARLDSTCSMRQIPAGSKLECEKMINKTHKNRFWC